MTCSGKFGLLLILVSPVGIANTLLDELLLCAKSNENLQRLACYDTVINKNINSHPEKHKVQQQASLQVATTEQVDNAKQQQAEFGQENQPDSKDIISQIQATVIKTKKAPRGELIISLDNGQVWRQTDSTHLKLRKDNLVIIERGALGSFFIGKENSNKRIRAKRVK
jgi:hypothetical protein